MRITEGRLIVGVAVLIVLLAVVRYAAAPDPSQCPPQFKRFTHPVVSLCYPKGWQRQSESRGSALVLFGGANVLLAVDVLPVSPTDFPPARPQHEEAIDRYVLEKGAVSRLRRNGLRLRARGALETIDTNGWLLRHRVLQGSTDGQSTYEAGKIYQMPVPVTVGLTTALVNDHIVLLTQYVASGSPEELQRSMDTFRAIRRTLIFKR